MTVQKLDGSSQDVFVRLVPVREFPRLLGAMEDEVELAEIFCAQPKGWADSLAPESLEAVVIRGDKLNDDFFSRWAKRRIARQERIMPGITEKRLGIASPTG